MENAADEEKWKGSNEEDNVKRGMCFHHCGFYYKRSWLFLITCS